MKIADIESFAKLDLVFGTNEPEEECDYLVVGELEAANGYVGIQFIVCSYLIGDAVQGEWYFAPDGLEVKGGVPMWDGSDGTTHAPFKPMKWAKLPEPTDD